MKQKQPRDLLSAERKRAGLSYDGILSSVFAIVLGLMRSNVWLTGSAMLAGKTLRYIVVLATFRGALSLF